MTLEELRALLKAQHERMMAINDIAKVAKRDLNDTEVGEYDEANASFKSLKAQIEREEELQARSAHLNTIIDTPLVPQTPSIPSDEDNSEAYRSAFWTAQRGQPLTPEQTRSLNVATDDKGGYLVPESFAATIITKLNEKTYIRDIATVSTSTSTENLPVEGDDGANGWIDEDGTYPESDPSIGRVQLSAWKTGRIIKVTDEAMQDTIPAIENYVAMKFAKSTTTATEASFVDGDGVKKPTGFLVTAIVGKTSATATAVTADEILDLEYSLDEDYAANAHFMMNRNTLAIVRKIKNANGDYVWSRGLSGEPDTLDGYPIKVNKHMPDIATGAKAIAFGDFSYYHIKDRTVMTIKRLNELYAGTGHVGFRTDARLDGKLVLPEAIKVLQQA